MKDVKRIRDKVCPSKSTMVQLNLDGVQESKSSVVSLDIYSIAFNKCRSIYPLKIIRPTNKFKINEQDEIAKVLRDINANELFIYCGIFDNPKRSVVRCAKSHSGYYACEYCECPAKLLITDILSADNTKKRKKTQLVWPYSTRKGKLRTVNAIRNIANRIENEGPIDKHEAKGITGKSHFLEQPFFNFIKDLPAEYMHLTCLGVTKRLVEMSFIVGENRDQLTKRKLSDPDLFNLLIRLVQMPREFGRRCRNLDFAVYKAQEFRNLTLFFFVLVIQCIEPEYTDEIKLWLYFAFAVRACIIPNSEFRSVPDKVISDACDSFYQLYERLFGEKNCTYSVHVVGSHLIQVRGTQPLTFRSAFKFESFFSEMKNMYVAGTMSTPKQILENCYMKRAVEHHTCEKTIFYDAKKSPVPGKAFLPGLENNSLIYIDDEQDNHNMYEITKVENNNSFTCVKKGKFEYKSELIPNLNWSQVGVYKEGPTVTEQQITISRDEICGKVLKVDNYLITCPNNVLQEK